MLGPSHRLRYEVSLRLRQLFRYLQNFILSRRFSTTQAPCLLDHLIETHQTPLFRHLKGVDSQLFTNKRENLRLAIKRMNQVIIPPKKMFSFWQIVGAPLSSRGFLPGLVISNGAASKGVGGGLCQLSNALFWLALHTDLRVTERHRHSFDLFPDEARQIPFGTGATVFYNYKDLRFFNPTTSTYQFVFELTDTHLIARIFCSERLSYSFQIEETDHQFIKIDSQTFRRNKIWKIKKGSLNETLSVDLLFENQCCCQYEIPR